MFSLLFSLLLGCEEPAPLDVTIPEKSAICIMDGRSETVLYQKNGQEPLVPASTLKILSAAAVLDTLGYDYHFKTVIYSSEEPVLLPDGRLSVRNLYIKGYGDPLMTSEELVKLVSKLPAMEVTGKLIIDTGYFAANLGIIQEPGVLSPYNALNSAFAVNYNTLAFSVSKDGLEPEENTPFVPYVKYNLEKWRKRTLYVDLQPQNDHLEVIAKGCWNNTPKKFRIHLGFEPEYGVRYAAWLFLTLYKNFHELELTNKVELGPVPPNAYELLTYQSEKDVTAAVRSLLEYSNNFIANQLLLIAGAERYGAPATNEKGLQLLRAWLDEHHIDGVEIFEASGLDPRNRVSACNMARILANSFERGAKAPDLLNKTRNFYYKTGTFTKNGVRNIAGYLQHGDEPGRHVAVFLCNGPQCKEEIRQENIAAAGEWADFLYGDGATEPLFAPWPEEFK